MKISEQLKEKFEAISNAPDLLQKVIKLAEFGEFVVANFDFIYQSVIKSEEE